MAGKKCSECGAHAVIRKDGCDYCTQCGHLGSCGMNTPRPTIPLKVASGKPSKEALAQLDKHWRVQYLMLAAPLAELLPGHGGAGGVCAVVGRGAGGLAPRAGWACPMPRATLFHPTLVHSAVMVLGFIPLYFAGFLFTAGPKWLGVDPLPVSAVRPPLFCKPLGGCCGSPGRICTPLWPSPVWRWRAPGSHG